MNTPQIGQIVASFPSLETKPFERRPTGKHSQHLPAIVTAVEPDRFFAVIFGAPGNPHTMSAWFPYSKQGEMWEWLHNLPQEPDETITDDGSPLDAISAALVFNALCKAWDYTDNTAALNSIRTVAESLPIVKDAWAEWIALPERLAESDE